MRNLDTKEITALYMNSQSALERAEQEIVQLRSQLALEKHEPKASVAKNKAEVVKAKALKFPEPIDVVGGYLFYGVHSAFRYTEPREVATKDGKVFMKKFGKINVFLGSPCMSVTLDIISMKNWDGNWEAKKLVVPWKPPVNGKTYRDIELGENFEQVSRKLFDVCNEYLSKNLGLVKEVA